MRAERREIAALKDIQLGFARAVSEGDVSDASLLNHRFHAQIGAMAENPYLDAALGRMLIDHTRLSQTFDRAETREDESRISLASAQHDEMIEAFAARDGAWATDITLKHWELSQDSLERFVRPDPLPFELEALRDAV
ncbi:MAG: FCD domain-containing protein [Pseudomonadota bacterium]